MTDFIHGSFVVGEKVHGYAYVARRATIFDEELISWANRTKGDPIPVERTAGESASDRRKELQGGAPGSAASPLEAGVRRTSREAYREHKSSGGLTAQQLVVVEHFVARPGLKATRQELARDLGLGINAVCGRVNELLRGDPPVLVERGRKRCSVTGNDVNALELST